MYISQVEIENFRCFEKHVVEFNEGINVIIGENNSGKTALLKALGLVFNSGARGRLTKHDFYQGIEGFDAPPSIIVKVTLRSSGDGDTVDDKALVATWLTKLYSPWEAELTYKYFLPEEDVPKFNNRLGQTPNKEKFWDAVEFFLPRYVYRIYAGELSAQNKAEPEWLSKFDYQFLDAIRDVESELFSGSNPLLKSMLYQVLDSDLEDDDEGNREKHIRTEKFNRSSNILKRRLVKRLKLDSLFTLVKQTGAKDGGEPTIGGMIGEQDIIAALKMFIKNSDYELPASYNGLGYNNLIYISLVLANLDFQTSIKQRGQNAALFPLLLIEEPEAHLHPALQYKLLKYINGRVKKEPKSRQIFLTTHSTHITSACGLDQIVCMSIDEGSIAVSYPGKVFCNDEEGQKSRKYVERYLDATKSNMLFSKGIIFVEGLAEQILLPCFSEYMGVALEENHIAVIAVGGSTFKHFLPIFGSSRDEELRKYRLRRCVACLVDADPNKKEKGVANPRWKKCWPYELNFDLDNYDYNECSSVVGNLESMCSDIPEIEIISGKKTLEYDIALANAASGLLITSSCKHKNKLEEFIEDPSQKKDEFEVLIKDEVSKDALDAIEPDAEQKANRFATYYLLSVDDGKGEHAFDLERQLRANLERAEADRKDFVIPDYIVKAIKWACDITV